MLLKHKTSINIIRIIGLKVNELKELIFKIDINNTYNNI